tara:strand:+ start:221 stop:547 length:327 start_codon:yes stop_codon:yes gene_type:complete
MSAVRKSETCEQQLRRMCKTIAEEISDENNTMKQLEAFMDAVYDIRYIVDREKRYLGAELMVAGGGPTIWVNLYTKEVEGFWGFDKIIEPFIDNLGLNDYMEELYACT